MALRPSDAHLDPLLGISRIARVTGLDRVGVEVACAVRPSGHILQVCNGKGESWAEAVASARMEAAELWAAETLDERRLRFGTADVLREAGEGVLAPRELTGGTPPVEGLAARGARCAWVDGVELFSRARAWVPAWAVYCPPQGGPLLGPSPGRWTSNGMGAHRSFDAALRHALFEAVERHLLAEALPSGWTRGAVARSLLPDRALARVAPRLAAWRRRLSEVGMELFLFDLTPDAARGRLSAPLAAALLFDREGGPLPLAAGYACRGALAEALRAAFLEAAQSRLTDIHGAREDVQTMDRAAARSLWRWCEQAGLGARRPPGHAPRGGLDAPRLLERLFRAGFRRAVAVELAGTRSGLSVVKVLIPGLEVSWLL